MEIIRHIKVDLYRDTQHFAVAAKQMDMGTRYIGVTLMEDGVVYEIPDNVEVIINMTKPDKTHVHSAIIYILLMHSLYFLYLYCFGLFFFFN